MTLNCSQLDLRIPGCALAISARRIWEHTEFGQVNPFAPVPAEGPVQPEAYVDIVNMSGAVQLLTGLTLEDALAGRQDGVVRVLVKQLLRHVGSPAVRDWLASVQQHLLEFTHRRASRNMPQPFLPEDSASPFGVRGLHSSLKNWLHEHRFEKASAQQWRQRIDTLAEKGVRADELAFCGLNDNLPEESDQLLDGDAIADCVNFDALRLSVLPAVRPAHARLEFVRMPANADIKRAKPKLKAGLVPRPQWRDGVQGYRIDIVEWFDLLGPMHGWMAFTQCGEPVTSDSNPSGLCDTQEEAKRLANLHAEKLLPGMSTPGEWAGIREAGCHEWLVTLPYYAPSYFCSQFDHRNVLLYMRYDLREISEDARVLLLQEVRSDWAQQARRDRKVPGTSLPIPVPPWLQEWPALALKLALLHAAQCGAKALAWTTGDMQIRRDGETGRADLIELVDRTLPAEAERLLARYGKQCERAEFLQPANFFIEPADGGYEVRDRQGGYRGSAATWEEALASLPAGEHALSASVHGVVLDDKLRKVILADGFFAWGSGLEH